MSKLFMDNYDLVVVGGGAGLNILNMGLSLGMKCALVEPDKFGGTCLNRGCIPSKILVYPADLIREAQHAKKIGISVKIENIDWNLISKRMWYKINMNQGIEKGMSKKEGLTIYRGFGEFVDEYTMTIISKEGNELGTFKGEQFVIATGGRSFIPPIEGLNEAGYITSESFFGDKFPDKPWKSLVIIGGGVIAVEFAHVFSAFGTKVSIVEMLPRLVSTKEPEISTFLEKNMGKYLNIYVDHRAIKVQLENGLKVLTIKNTQTGDEQQIKAEEILVATGRRSNADILKVEKTGVEVNKRRWIITNKFLETSKKNIWCLGDANGLYQFRHKANYELRILKKNIFSEGKHIVDYSSVPWAIFTYPQIGHVGMTEAEAMEKGNEIFVGKHHYSSVAKGYAMGFDQGADDDGFVKLIVDKYRKILGAHIVGPFAAILVQQFVYLMNAGFTCDKVDDLDLDIIPKDVRACPEAGALTPINSSMIIHPSMNELTAWAIGSLKSVNIKK